MRKISNFGKKLKGSHVKTTMKTSKELDILNVKNIRVLKSCSNKYEGALQISFMMPDGKISRVIPDNNFYRPNNDNPVDVNTIIERFNTLKFNIKANYYIITKHKQYEHKTWRKDCIRTTSNPIQPIHNGKR